MDEATYHSSKREDISRLVEYTPEMCLWTAPIAIAEVSFDVHRFGQIYGVLKVYQLDMFNYCILTILAVVGHDIVWLDV